MLWQIWQVCEDVKVSNSFGEDAAENKDSGNCCDVYKMELQLQDMTEELRIVADAITTIGAKGEVKIAQWIRGSLVIWTSSFNRKSMSYENSKGRSETWW